MAAAFHQPCPVSGRALAEFFAVDTMVSVVDASGFRSALSSGAPLQEPEALGGPAGHGQQGQQRAAAGCAEALSDGSSGVAALLVSQLELADVVLLNKADLAEGGAASKAGGPRPVHRAAPKRHAAAWRGLCGCLGSLGVVVRMRPLLRAPAQAARPRWRRRWRWCAASTRARAC